MENVKSTWSLALENGNSREGGSETNYIKFQDGNNQIRILDKEPKAVWVHWLATANQGKGLSVMCLGKGCPMCAKYKYDKANNVATRDRLNRQFVINIYNRETERVEILQKGKSIFETLATFHMSMGDITGYDINIVKSGKGLDTKYTPVPVVNSKPVPSDLSLYDLNDITKQLDPVVVELLISGMSLEDATKTVSGTQDAKDLGIEEIETEEGFTPFK